MKDNIQKLYEIVGVGSIGFNTYTLKEEYPPFTAEKQLELIKWLVNKYDDLRIERKIGMYYLHIPQIYTGEYSVQFEEGLTGLIIFLWQDLSDDQKQEIKRILQ